LGEIARSVNVQIDVLVEVNVGHDRCGVDPKYFRLIDFFVDIQNIELLNVNVNVNTNVNVNVIAFWI
jgi:hypothetical protein